MKLPPLLSTLARRPRPSGGALLPALDALRGIAVLAVFAQHLGDTHLPFVRERIAATVPESLAPWILTVLHHAHWGVDLFFVLSGFSLAQPLIARLARAAPGDPDPLALSSWGPSFAVRRAARLYPAYLAALALVLVVVPSLVRHPSFPASLAVHLALLQGYVTPGGLAIIGAAWSLTTEVCFYAAWPLLAPRLLERPPLAASSYTSRDRVLSAAPSRSVRPWLTGLSIVVAGWLVRAVLHELALRPGAPPWLLETSQHRWAVSRLDQFVLGALAAGLHARLARSPSAARLSRLAPAGIALSIAALVPAFYLEGSSFGTPLGAWPYGLISIATAALVLAAACAGEGAARWLFPRPLCAVGVVSYGVFLNHQLAIGVTMRLSGAPGTWGALGRHAALSLALSLAFGGLSWVLVERPFIEWAARRTRKREGEGKARRAERALDGGSVSGGGAAA